MPSIDKTADFLDGGLKGEVADDASQSALGDPTVWPTRLESDLRVANLLTSGHQIVRRSVAVIVIHIPLIGDITMPVNLLAFNVADGNGFAGLTLKGSYNVAVAGDPTSRGHGCDVHAEHERRAPPRPVGRRPDA